jgi:hypothetical protein
MSTGAPSLTIPNPEDKFDEEAFLSIPEMALREVPYYKLAHDLTIGAQDYKAKGLFAFPVWSSRNIVRTKDGEIKYPLNSYDTIMNFAGFSLKSISQDSMMQNLPSDLLNKMKKFEVDQFDKKKNITIAEMITITKAVRDNIVYRNSKEYEDIFKTIVSLEQIEKEQKIREKIKESYVRVR